MVVWLTKVNLVQLTKSTRCYNLIYTQDGDDDNYCTGTSLQTGTSKSTKSRGNINNPAWKPFLVKLRQLSLIINSAKSRQPSILKFHSSFLINYRPAGPCFGRGISIYKSMYLVRAVVDLWPPKQGIMSSNPSTHLWVFENEMWGNLHSLCSVSSFQSALGPTEN